MSSHLLLPSFFFFFPLSQGHMKQKNGSHCPFRPVAAAVSAGISRISLFRWPFRPKSAVSACFDGRFGCISFHFRQNQSESARFGPNRRESARIWLSRREWTQIKKKGGELASRMLNTASTRIGLRCGNLGAASMLSRWAFTGVYGPNLNKRRRKMWEELTWLISWWDLPWCIGGDFNIIRFPSEILGAASCTWAMYGFSNFISLHGPMDIPMDGGLYTRSNTSSTSRIDRFLFSPLLADHFTMFTQKRLSKVLSDHFPILLEGGSLRKGRTPFCFENMW